MVAWVCIAAPSLQKNSPFAAQLIIAFRRFLFLMLYPVLLRYGLHKIKPKKNIPQVSHSSLVVEKRFMAHEQSANWFF